MLSVQGLWVQSLAEELRSHIQHSQKVKKGAAKGIADRQVQVVQRPWRGVSGLFKE